MLIHQLKIILDNTCMCIGYCIKLLHFSQQIPQHLTHSKLCNFFFLSPPGRWSSRGREQSRATLWWVRVWGRPSALTSKWQRATITAGTLEERQQVCLRERSQTDRVGSNTVLLSAAAWENNCGRHAQTWWLWTVLEEQGDWDTTLFRNVSNLFFWIHSLWVDVWGQKWVKEMSVFLWF